MPTIFVKHPIDKTLKAEIKSKHPDHKIIDLKFKPNVLNEGDLEYGEDKPKATRKRKNKASDQGAFYLIANYPYKY